MQTDVRLLPKGHFRFGSLPAPRCTAAAVGDAESGQDVVVNDLVAGEHLRGQTPDGAPTPPHDR